MLALICHRYVKVTGEAAGADSRIVEMENVDDEGVLLSHDGDSSNDGLQGTAKQTILIKGADNNDVGIDVTKDDMSTESLGSGVTGLWARF